MAFSPWRAQHLDRRLPSGSLAGGAWGGLQDSAPRSGALSLHARVAGTRPEDWRDPSLAQVWGPRGAVYLVPRADLAVFTLGRRPRDPDWRPQHERDVAILGRTELVWDTRTTKIIEVETPAVDVEGARVELARRFVGWFGSLPARRFARWAGVEPADARLSLAGVEDPVVDSPAEEGVLRLLPPGDPYLWGRPREVVTDPDRHARVFVNGPGATGVVCLDGVGVGAWVRQQGRVTVELWRDSAELRPLVEAEAAAFPLAAPVQVRFAEISVVKPVRR